MRVFHAFLIQIQGFVFKETICVRNAYCESEILLPQMNNFTKF